MNVLNMISCRFLYFVPILCSLLAATSCKHVGQFYHNTTAHYNAYFMANEKMTEAEYNMLRQHKDNYNKIIDVLPGLKLESTKGMSGDMDYCIKKASIPIQLHQSSVWTDNCYLVIGKARFYKDDIENATATFKFINTKSKDFPERHEALVWLMRTYIKNNDYESAQDVFRYVLDKEKENLNDDNKRELFLTRAAYLIEVEKDYENALKYLLVAERYMKRGDRRNRVRFVIAQLYQKLGEEAPAHAYYKLVIKGNPTYEMSFYAKLYAAQVTAIADEKALKDTRKRFKKMLKDEKNKEYKDKIYYEMALFELKQNKEKTAINLFKESIKVSTNPVQKGYSYLELGKLYYKNKDFVLAKNYYDSTVTSIDKDIEGYKDLVRRQRVLKEFVEQYMIVKKEDSLQRLSKMSPEALRIMAQNTIRKEDSTAKAQAELAKKLKKQQEKESQSGGGGAGSIFDQMGRGNNSSFGGNSKDKTWYFENPAAVSQGRSEFIKRWGNRTLEDNWRRSKKEKDPNFNAPKPEEIAEEKQEMAAKEGKQENGEGDAIAEGKEKSAKKELSAEEELEARIKKYMETVPKDSAKMAQSDERLRAALLQLGKIYDQKLEEKDNAIESFERVVNEYPNWEKTPEALYSLCLLYQKKNPEKYEKYKRKLTEDHPKTVFAKLIVNPNYLLDNQARNKAISPIYEQAYEYYKAERYVEAQNILKSLKQQYPESDYEDNIALLETLIVGYTTDVMSYRNALLVFQLAYPKSDLQPYVSELLQVVENYIKNNGNKVQQALPQDLAKSVSPYSTDGLDGTQYFVAVFPLAINANEVKAGFMDFDGKFYDNKIFTTTDMLLDNNRYIIRTMEFPTRIQALAYLKKVREERASPLQQHKGMVQASFMITPANFKVFYQLKDVKQYVDFFEKNYVITEKDNQF